MIAAEEHSALPVVWSEFLLGVAVLVVPIIVGVASYRRCRCLSDYPVYKSLAIAAINGIFWQFWVVVSLVNRTRTAQDWAEYRAGRDATTTDVLVDA